MASLVLTSGKYDSLARPSELKEAEMWQSLIRSTNATLERAAQLTVLILACCSLAPCSAQQLDISGDYAGTLGSLHLKLHIQSDQGKLTGTMDSPDQGAKGIPCVDFHLDGQNLTFAVPAVNGTWKGTVDAGGKRLTGTWNQGQPMALEFTRDTFQPASKPSAVDGVWLGTLVAGAASLRIQVNVKSDAAGHEYCTLDSLDQRAMGLE